MTNQKILRGFVLFTSVGILLGACSRTNTSLNTDTTTGQVESTATPEPSASPESNAQPPASPEAQQQGDTQNTTSANAQLDTTQKGPQLSKKDDADSLNTDLNNTTIDTETFN